jgi:hypothetical protein
MILIWTLVGFFALALLYVLVCASLFNNRTLRERLRMTERIGEASSGAVTREEWMWRSEEFDALPYARQMFLHWGRWPKNRPDPARRHR